MQFRFHSFLMRTFYMVNVPYWKLSYSKFMFGVAAFLLHVRKCDCLETHSLSIFEMVSHCHKPFAWRRSVSLLFHSFNQNPFFSHWLTQHHLHELERLTSLRPPCHGLFLCMLYNLQNAIFVSGNRGSIILCFDDYTGEQTVFLRPSITCQEKKSTEDVSSCDDSLELWFTFYKDTHRHTHVWQEIIDFAD